MMRQFTRFTAILTFVFGIFVTVKAQQVILTLESPESAKGNYALLRSSFGEQTSREFNGDLVLANPALACEPITNNVTGKVVMIDRGTCEFAQKVQNGQDHGAIAVLICNDDREIINPAAGTINDGSLITIPSFMMEKSDCAKIKLALASNTINAIFRFRPCEPLAPANTIWGNQVGEGDFNGGINDWIIDTDPTKGWVWTADGDVSAGAYISPNTFMQTPTICNGAMVINSDFLDNGGDPNGIGTCPAPCISSIISPNIDLTGKNIQGLTVQFNTSIRQFLSDYYLMISTDNGASWPDTFTLMGDYFTNDFISLNDVVRVGLCGFDNSATQIRLRFQCLGNYYFWGIDDVFLINEAAADPQTNLSFYAVSPSYKTPVSQASKIPFLADVRNNGAVPSVNTVLNVDVYSGATTLFHASKSYGTLAPCEQVENQVFSELYDMPKTVGTYTIRYDINSDGNSISTNDLQSADFVMTENVFANMASEAEYGGNYMGSLGGGVNTANIGNYYSVGNYFFVPNGDNYIGSSVTFGVSDAALGNFGGLVNAHIYKVIGDINGDGSLTSDERVIVGKSEDPFYTVDNTTVGRRKLTLNVFGVDDAGEVDPAKTLDLEDNTGYLVMLDVYPTVGTAFYPFLSVRTDTRNTRIRNFYYGATNLAFDELLIERFGSMISAGGTSSDNPTERTFNPFFKTAYVEWQVVAGPNGTNDAKEDLSFDVYPNPVKDLIYVDMNLGTSSNVKLEVFDLAGKKMNEANYANIRTEKLTLDAASLSTGMYVLKVTTDEGFSSKKFAVAK